MDSAPSHMPDFTPPSMLDVVRVVESPIDQQIRKTWGQVISGVYCWSVKSLEDEDTILTIDPDILDPSNSWSLPSLTVEQIFYANQMTSLLRGEYYSLHRDERQKLLSLSGMPQSVFDGLHWEADNNTPQNRGKITVYGQLGLTTYAQRGRFE